MKTSFALAILFAAALVSFSLRAEQTPKPRLDTDPPAEVVSDNGNEMPLSLYKKLKVHFDHLAGVPTGLLPGIPIPTKEEVEKDLATDTSANQAVLIKALSSSQAIHREMAALALQFSSDKAASVEALNKVLSADSNENVRRAAVISLARVPDASSEDALIKALGDSDEGVRALSARALGSIKDPKASEPLLNALDGDSAAVVRLQAALALRKIADPKSLDGLKKALGSEKDEHVMSAIASAVKTLMGGTTPEAEEIPSPEQQVGQLTKLASDMKDIEGKLRDDRHDQLVQLEGAKVEQALSQLIDKLEKSCNNSSSCQNPGEKQKQSQNDPSKKNAKSGMQDSKKGGVVPPGATTAAQVTNTADEWSKLPPAQRAELMQAFREDVPERWRKRLEAYFLSVNAEENKEATP